MLTKDQRISEVDLYALEDKHGLVMRASQAAIARRGVTPPDDAVEWECVFRAPGRRELAMFTQSIDSGSSAATRAMAPESLALTCVVHVSGADGDARTAFAALIERFPGIPHRVTAGIAKLAGFEAEEK